MVLHHHKVCSLGAALIFLTQFCSSFYLPGLAPVNYCLVDHTTETCKVGVTERGRIQVWTCTFWDGKCYP